MAKRTKRKIKTKQKPKTFRDRISSGELEALTGLTDRRHRQLADAGHIPQPTNGHYATGPTLAGLFRYFIATRDSRSKELQQARIDRAQSQARLAKVDADLAEKAVVSLDDVRRVWTTNGMRAKFLIYESVTQIAAQAQMHLSLSTVQADKLREIVKTHQHRAVVEIWKGELCKLECPKCHQEIECPPRNYENQKTQGGITNEK